MSKRKKKPTPLNRPATLYDVKKAKQEAMAEATTHAMAIMLTVLVDKFNARDYIADVWREIIKLSEEITEGRVSVADLKYVLRKEYDVYI